MTTAIAIRPSAALTAERWNLINQIAPAAHMSRLFGVASPAAAMMIMAKGLELGLPLTASFELIHVIDGKPGLSPRGALALLHQSPLIARITINRLAADSGAYVGHECTIERRDGFKYTARFTMADARRANLIKPKSGWEHYPENMCLWRAVGYAADVAAPDITGGMKTADQYGAALDVAGDVIAGDWTEADDVAADGVGAVDLGQDDPGDIAAAVQGLVDEYGAEAVLNANDGRIPITLEEVDALRYALIAADGEGDAAQ